MLTIRLEATPFEPLQALATWHAALAAQLEDPAAAESHFIGRVRARSAAGPPLTALELEHYPGMTERQLLDLAIAAAARHGVAAVLVHHRVGRVQPGEAIVLVAVVADRRGPALRCGQELLEALKHEAPFWKREWLADGRGTWVQGNTPL
ncbi:MAG: molybdenum cofactor biosynthesis protein MoaE [Cyanobacteriota bacterium]